jgi:hypothetical protein
VQKWLDTLQFWEDVQEYRQLFYQDSMDPFIVKRHAQVDGNSLQSWIFMYEMSSLAR